MDPKYSNIFWHQGINGLGTGWKVQNEQKNQKKEKSSSRGRFEVGCKADGDV